MKFFIIGYDIKKEYQQIAQTIPDIIKNLEFQDGDVIPHYDKLIIVGQKFAYFYSDWIELGKIDIRNE